MTVPRMTRAFFWRARISRVLGRDLALGEDAGGHLVEQRLEQVVGRLGDERDLDVVAALERLRAEEPAETGADDDDAVRGHAVPPQGRRVTSTRENHETASRAVADSPLSCGDRCSDHRDGAPVDPPIVSDGGRGGSGRGLARCARATEPRSPRRAHRARRPKEESNATKVEKSVVVDVPVSTRNQWTQFEEFPEFMGAVQEVEQLDDQRRRLASDGGADASGGVRILEQRPGEDSTCASSAPTRRPAGPRAHPGRHRIGRAADLLRPGPARAASADAPARLEVRAEGVVEKAGDALS